jgi:hypothetical protein
MSDKYPISRISVRIFLSVSPLLLIFLLFGTPFGQKADKLPVCGKDKIPKIRVVNVFPDNFDEFEIPPQDPSKKNVPVRIEVENKNPDSSGGGKCELDSAKLEIVNVYEEPEKAERFAGFTERTGNSASNENTVYEAEIRVERPGYYRLSVYYDGYRISTSHIDFFVKGQPEGNGENGIFVLPPKIYDERSLVEKLQELEAVLAGKLFIDQSKISGAIGSLQGATQDVSAFGLQVTTVPLPAVTETVNLGSNSNSSPTGTSTSTTSSSNTVTNSAALSAAPPSLPGQTPSINPTQSFSQSASTLLAEQMQLSYEIINIRTLLERATSDRVDVRNGNSRGLAVLGFGITIDSDKQYRDAVAEVRVRIKNLVGKKVGSPNIVSLIPQEKTYNVATVTKKSRQFGFGAVVQPISFGISTANSRDTFYLVRDTDTVAMAGIPYAEETDVKNRDNSKKVSFAWQFRPVLGRRIVQPGTRNVFALLSLPPNELENGEDTHYVADVEVQTIWRKYDAKKGLIGEPVGEPSYQHFEKLVVPQYANDFSVPKIDNIKWEDVGNGQALVIVQGKKFIRGTEVIVGNIVLNTENKGVVSRDENSLRFLMPIAQLGTLNDIFLSSRFGSPRPLRREFQDDEGIEIYGKPTLSAVDAKTTRVTMYIAAKSCKKDPGKQLCIPGFYSDREKNKAEKVANTYGYKEIVRDAFDVERLNRPLVIVGNQVFGFTTSPIKIEKVFKQIKKADNSLPSEDEETSFKKALEKGLNRTPTEAEINAELAKNGFETNINLLKLTVAVPTQLLSDTGNIEVKYPFLDPSKFTAASDIEFQEAFGASGVQILSATDKTVQLLISGRKFDEYTYVLIGGAKYTACSPPCTNELKALNKKLLLLDLPYGSKELSAINSLIVSQGDKFIVLPVEQKALPSITPEFHPPFPVINLGDSKTFMFKGANLGSIQDIRFEGNSLKFQVKNEGATLLVDFTTDVTQFIGTKKLTYILKDGKSDSIEIKIN